MSEENVYQEIVNVAHRLGITNTNPATVPEVLLLLQEIESLAESGLKIEAPMTNLDMVKEFHQKFIPEEIPTAPRLLPTDIHDFRVKFMKEEIAEFDDARANGDLGQAADALVDLAYVNLGTAVMMGLPWSRIFNAVHAANMQKVRAVSEDQSTRRSRFDVVKPRGWQHPNIDEILDQYK